MITLDSLVCCVVVCCVVVWLEDMFFNPAALGSQRAYYPGGGVGRGYETEGMSRVLAASALYTILSVLAMSFLTPAKAQVTTQVGLSGLSLFGVSFLASYSGETALPGSGGSVGVMTALLATCVHTLVGAQRGRPMFFPQDPSAFAPSPFWAAEAAFFALLHLGAILAVAGMLGVVAGLKASSGRWMGDDVSVRPQRSVWSSFADFGDDVDQAGGVYGSSVSWTDDW